MNVSDGQFLHKTYKKRGVRQKTFLEQVGVHGLRKVPCHTVTVIYDRTNYKVITAFPTIWWNNAKEIEGMKRCSYNNEDIVYNDSLICAVIKERSNCCLTFQLFLGPALSEGGQDTVKFYLLRSQPIPAVMLHPTGNVSPSCFLITANDQ